MIMDNTALTIKRRNYGDSCMYIQFLKIPEQIKKHAMQIIVTIEKFHDNLMAIVLPCPSKECTTHLIRVNPLMNYL